MPANRAVRPSCTIAYATSGWMPTRTVSAPRKRAASAIPRSVRVANESITSSSVTSTITPRLRNWPTRVEQAVLQLPPVGIGDRGLNGRDQAFALLENRHRHRFCSLGRGGHAGSGQLPCSPLAAQR